jgi:hypothetical protein
MVKKQNLEKSLDYSQIIGDKFSELFVADAEGNTKIDYDDFQDGDNLNHFIHALGNIVPTIFFRNLTGNIDVSILDFNHIANKLCIQYVELGGWRDIEELAGIKNTDETLVFRDSVGKTSLGRKIDDETVSFDFLSGSGEGFDIGVEVLSGYTFKVL